MKNWLDKLDKTLESKTRLGIMAILTVSDAVDFNYLKTQLNLTDGNLASHITALEKAEYLTINKSFVGKKTQTTYFITDLGRIAFKNHIDALEEMLKDMNKS